MSKKSNRKILLAVVILATVLALSWLALRYGKDFRVTFLNGGTKIDFQTLQSGVRFKSPVGADVTISVVSADLVTVKSVEQDGKDTVVRLSPVAKK